MGSFTSSLIVHRMCSGRFKLFAGLFFLCIVGCSISGCQSEKRNHSYSDVPDANIAKGKALAAVYCQSCHSLPDPSMADARTWFFGILPEMGPRLGIFQYNHQRYPNERSDPNLPKDFYP